jgi:ribonuclease R
VKRPPRDTLRHFPTREDIVAFVRSQTGKIGTREIAREFGLKNADRAELRHILRTLADEGVIAKRGRHSHHAGDLPPVVLSEIKGRDSDGELVAEPVEWDEDRRGPPPKIHVFVPRHAHATATGRIGDRALLRVEEVDGGDETIRHRGRIIKIIDHGRHRVLGVFRTLPAGGGRMVPVDKKQLGREIAIAASDSAGAQDGDLITVELAHARSFGLPSGRVAERLGSLRTERAVSMIAIHAHDIPHEFSKAALREADDARPAALDGREDWRALPLVTVDPPDAKDHDDAVHAEADPDPSNQGGFILHVAIADVAFYVTPGSALDREAQERGNSVYFPDRVVPMLPERISNDLCSLKPGEARGALAVRMVIGADGRKRAHSFHRVLMRSAAKLTYAQAQAARDGQVDDTTGPLADTVIEPLYAAYDALVRARDQREPLDLDLPERKIILKPDGTVDRVVIPERLAAHRLIEEFMILANVAAAETLEEVRVPLIYRVHDEPTLEKIAALRDFLQTLDISLPKAGALRPAQFNRILAQIKGRDSEPLVNEIVLRAQAQAEYAAENYGHFGLNLRRYAHFTSPIRRYADLVVHRALIRGVRFGLGSGALPPDETAESLSTIAAAISATERRAMRAERETVDRLIAHFLADRVGATFSARVSGVTRAGLFVKLDDTGADGFVPARTIGTEYFHHDEGRQALVGSRSGEMYRLGDSVDVRLVEAAPVAGALRFELMSPGRIVHARTRGGTATPGATTSGRSGKATTKSGTAKNRRTALPGKSKSKRKIKNKSRHKSNRKKAR